MYSSKKTRGAKFDSSHAHKGHGYGDAPIKKKQTLKHTLTVPPLMKGTTRATYPKTST